jgi:hypothetical protein
MSISLSHLELNSNYLTRRLEGIDDFIKTLEEK